MMTCRRRERGFFLLDIAVGLGLVVVLMAVLITSTAQNRRAALATAQRQAAFGAAEEAMVALNMGSATRGARVEELSDAPAPRGWRWVRVRVAHEWGEAALDGLAPQSSVEAEP